MRNVRRLHFAVVVMPFVMAALVGCSANPIASLLGGSKSFCPLTPDEVKTIATADNVTSHFDDWGQQSAGKPKPFYCSYEISGTHALFRRADVWWSPGTAATLAANQASYPYNGFTLISTGQNSFYATNIIAGGDIAYLIESLLDGQIVAIEVSGQFASSGGSDSAPPQSTLDAANATLANAVLKSKWLTK